MPFAAPPVPPLTGASTATTSRRASSAATDRAVGAPVVEKLDEVADPAAGGEALRAEDDLADDLRGGEAGEDQLGPVRDLGGRRRGPGAQGGQALDRPGVDVVDDEIVTCVEQPAGHGRTHATQPDETQFHGGCPPRPVSGRRPRR
ncbi:hypothetical protein WBK50_20735 [Pseudonocardia sp. T1-2H]|uniref:hypothetical protein n=1 Tax=Pseudonocardia sp. T1-2H TaxID=3128899 RepID=UPI0031018CD9